MSWSVRWHHEAWLNLVKIIADDVDPPRVEKASEWIDYTLRRIPFDVGESREKNVRLWYGDVLGVYYIIDEEKRMITISAVGPAKRI